MNKICSKCNSIKDLSLFVKNAKAKDGFKNTCRRCHADYMNHYYSTNEQQRKNKNRLNSGSDANWKRHKISKEEFDTMVAKFNGKCHTCKKNDAKNIDHNHDCCPGYRSCGNCVRGILCNQCNTALGLVKDSPEVLQSLIDYLKN
jgi:cytochrome c5